MEPIDYAGALRRSWRLLVALAILGAVVAVLMPVSAAKRVKSPIPYTAIAIVGGAPTAPGSPLNGSVSAAQIQFFASTSDNLQTVAETAGLDVPTAALPSYMSASLIPTALAGTGAIGAQIKRNTPTVVQLTARGTTPAGAINLATTFANQLGIIVANKVTDRQGSGGSRFNRPGNTNANCPSDVQACSGYTILSLPSAASKGGHAKASLGASRKVRAGAGFAIGALLAAGLVLLRELLDKRLRNAARAEANFGFPVISEIPSAAIGPAHAPGAAPMVDVIRDPDSAGAEAYRMLRMSVMFEGLASLSGPTDPYALGFDAATAGHLTSAEAPALNGASEADGARKGGDRRVILVVSAASEPSRPYVAANLAAIYAEAGERVVVISTGEIEARFNGSDRSAVSGDIRPVDVEAHLEPSRLENVSRLPLTPFIARSGQLVTRMPDLLEAARDVSDAIIVEVPPLLTVHHAEALVRFADAVLVVAECRVTTFDHARRAGDLLRRIGAPVLGVVLTGARPSRSDARAASLNRPPDRGENVHRDEEPVAIGAGVGPSSTGDSPV
jgi:Mrp family chromosome partitioning ATPase